MPNRICNRCKKTLDLSFFYEFKGKHYKYNRSPRCKLCSAEVMREMKKRNLSAWKEILPVNPKCEICGKDLEYFSGNRKNSVHFDHKKEEVVITVDPNHWLRRNQPSEKNINKFKSCDFGILCCTCNRYLQTKNRLNLLKGIISYLKNHKENAPNF